MKMAILGRQYNKYSLKIYNTILTHSDGTMGQVTEEWGIIVRFKPYNILQGTLIEKPNEYKIWLDGGYVVFGLWNGATYTSIYSQSINPNEWHTVYAGIDYYNSTLSTGFCYLCVDEVTNYTLQSCSTLPTATSNALTFGSNYYGLIDDIKYYIQPITQNMIENIETYGYVYDQGLQLWNNCGVQELVSGSTYKIYDSLGDEYFQGIVTAFGKGKENEYYYNRNENVVIVTKQG